MDSVQNQKTDVVIKGHIVSNVVNWIGVLALNLIPDSRKVIPYSIQTLKRRKPDWFREDLQKVFNLLKQKKIKPIELQLECP